MIELEDDTMPTDEQIKVISDLCKQQLRAQKEVEEKEKELKEAQRKLRRIQEQELPDAMLAAGSGITMFETADGFNVSIKEDLKASIPKKNKPEAIAWLIEHGLESIVKENVEIPFDKGEVEKVDRLLEVLERNGFNEFSVKPTVNTATVKAALKELIEQGVDVPESTFGLYFYKQAIIKKP